MNESLNSELVEWIKKGGEFVESQAPQFASECAAWAFWGNVMNGSLWFVAISIIAGGLLWVGRWVRKSEVGHVDEWKHNWPGWYFAAALALVLAITVGLFHVVYATKAAIAPRVVVMEYLKSVAN